MKGTRAGFTLVELMTVAVIFLIVFTAIFLVLTMGRRSWQIGSAQVELQQEARRGMDAMIKELRQASSIDPTTFTDDLSNNIIRFTLSGQTVQFAVNGGQLQRTPTGVTPILAHDIENVQFRLLGGRAIYITLSTQRTTPLGRLVNVSLNSQVYLRN